MRRPDWIGLQLAFWRAQKLRPQVSKSSSAAHAGAVDLQKGDHMKRITWLAVLIFLGASVATAQSLGDYARASRKAKLQAASTSHHYDNDNLPKNQHLSVVGPESSVDADNPPAPAAASAPTDAAKGTTKDPKAEAADPQKATEDLQKKVDDQKQKVDALNHELDLAQREYRLRAASMYSDAGNRLRNQGAWDKEEAQYQQDMADKQKAIEAAKQQLDDAQEEAQKAGLKPKDKDDKDKDEE